jgi:hypothetical protein
MNPVLAIIAGAVTGIVLSYVSNEVRGTIKRQTYQLFGV